jgi:cell wall-associated NlpC family hydrolase
MDIQAAADEGVKHMKIQFKVSDVFCDDFQRGMASHVGIYLMKRSLCEPKEVHAYRKELCRVWSRSSASFGVLGYNYHFL